MPSRNRNQSGSRSGSEPGAIDTEQKFAIESIPERTGRLPAFTLGQKDHGPRQVGGAWRRGRIPASSRVAPNVCCEIVQQSFAGSRTRAAEFSKECIRLKYTVEGLKIHLETAILQGGCTD